MNAYELADELENYVWMNPNNNRDYCKEVKDMLRQQADRIERKQELIREQTALLVKQNNRIAELSKNVDELEEELLKTPQIKELSDVEISLIAEEFTGADGLDVVDFGRAILRKASEK
jgi:polyhydroxyalkanoate synthesis regulator phasin